MQELLNMINEHEFHDMEIAYIEHLEKLKIDLDDKNRDALLAYIDYLDSYITKLKESIIERFSPHNQHLTSKYMDELITTDRILFAELNFTTKSDDCLQYLIAKEQYALEYKDMLLSLPEVYSLSIKAQNDLWNMSMHVAELDFLLNQHWTIPV